MPKYENGCIYKLIHNDDYDNLNIYVGSTTNFRDRKYSHKSHCDNKNQKYDKKYDTSLYRFMRNNGGFGDFQMIQLEAFPCKTKRELELCERHWIELLKPTLNKSVPTRGSLLNHRDYQDEYYKKYQTEKNKRMLEKVVCECGCEISLGFLTQHKMTKKHLKLMEKQNRTL